MSNPFEDLRAVYRRKLAGLDEEHLLCEEQIIRRTIQMLKTKIEQQEALLSDVELRLNYLESFTPEKIIERSAQ